jgi:chromosome segregation ATPase
MKELLISQPILFTPPKSSVLESIRSSNNGNILLKNILVITAEEENGNGRIYPIELWEREITKFQQKINKYKSEVQKLQEKTNNINSVMDGILTNKSSVREKFDEEIKTLNNKLITITNNIDNEIGNNRQKLKDTIEQVNKLAEEALNNIINKFSSEQIDIQKQLEDYANLKQEQDKLIKEIETINLTINNIKLDMNSIETNIKHFFGPKDCHALKGNCLF